MGSAACGPTGATTLRPQTGWCGWWTPQTAVAWPTVQRWAAAAAGAGAEPATDVLCAALLRMLLRSLLLQVLFQLVLVVLRWLLVMPGQEWAACQPALHAVAKGAGNQLSSPQSLCPPIAGAGAAAAGGAVGRCHAAHHGQQAGRAGGTGCGCHSRGGCCHEAGAVLLVVQAALAPLSRAGAKSRFRGGRGWDSRALLQPGCAGDAHPS